MWRSQPRVIQAHSASSSPRSERSRLSRGTDPASREGVTRSTARRYARRMLRSSPAVTAALLALGIAGPASATIMVPLSLAELATFFDPIGGSYRNPLDAAYATETPAMFARDLDILERDPNIDAIAVDFFGTIMSTKRLRSDFGVGLGFRDDLGSAAGTTFLDVLVDRAQHGTKPIFTIVTGAEKERESLELRDILRDAGVLVFSSAERAARAYVNTWQASMRR